MNGMLRRARASDHEEEGVFFIFRRLEKCDPRGTSRESRRMMKVSTSAEA